MAEEVQEVKKVSKTTKLDYVFAVGRRKSSVARVRIYSQVKAGLTWEDMPIKKGEIIVNQKAIAAYFPSDVERKLYEEPLRVINAQNNYAITVKVVGGGQRGQLDAVIAGIAKALSNLDVEKHRPILKKKGLLTRDARVRQRRNVGTGGKARRKKQSPKR